MNLIFLFNCLNLKVISKNILSVYANKNYIYKNALHIDNNS